MNSTSYPVRISKDIVYGTGAIQPESDGQIRLRNLTLDLYEPIRSDNTQKCPALIMAFGGAFHRGTKEDDTFGEPPAQNNSVAWYCQAFARRGFITCSIDYRLIPENPEPGCTPVVFDPNTIPRSRVDEVRRLMGLPKASQQLLWRGIEAASDDMRLAVSFVRRKAEQWNIDTAKIAIGGFSAGARTALNVALGERETVAAVVSLSGYIDISDLEKHASNSSRLPPVLFIHADNDLDYIRTNTSTIVARLRSLGGLCEAVRVQGATHFYPANALAYHEQNGATTVEEAMETFLEQTLLTQPASGSRAK
ncbi:MAG TPA: alpha/beta hydrolase [Advenella sp.]|nr:alpha/beta hydrolase [Advenella sp.]